MDNGAFSWLMVRGPAAAAIGPLMSIAGPLSGALGGMMGGQGQAAADQFKAQQLDQEAQYGQLRATQTTAAMTRNLSSTLANIDAVRAARHDSPQSPSGMAVRGQTEALGDEQKNVQVESILEQSRMDTDAAAYLRHASSQAMMSGDIGAGADIFKGLGGAFASGSGGSGSGNSSGSLFNMSDPSLRIFG